MNNGPFAAGGNGAGKQLFWHRAEIDGVPFRGAAAPLLREDEFESQTVRVADAKYGTFDTSQPDSTCFERTLQAILAGQQAGHYRVLDYKTTWSALEGQKPVMFVFVVWLELFVEMRNGDMTSQTQGGTDGDTRRNGFL